MDRFIDFFDFYKTYEHLLLKSSMDRFIAVKVLSRTSDGEF